jgi:two-component system, NtrC family, response regulator PilR
VVTLSDGRRIGASELQLRRHADAPAPAPAQPAPPPAGAGTPLEQRVEEVEKRAIREALEKTRGNKTRAAELLGMTFRQLRYKVKKLRIE